MMKINIFFLLFFLINSVYAQRKPIAYLYFDKSECYEGVCMYESTDYNATRYTYVKSTDYGKKRVYYSSLDSSSYQVVDSLYLKQFVIKSPLWHFNKPKSEGFSAGYDREGNLTGNTSYRKAYLVEKIEANEFKIIQIVPFIGTFFYAPGNN